MIEPLLNLHNHTPFSDGAYTIDEIVEAHLDLDVPVTGIGISDHLFATPSSKEVSNEREFVRLFGPEREAYVQQVREARDRWGDRMEIYCGAEINWPLNKGMLPQIISLLDGIDYVLFEFVDWSGLTLLANQSRRFPCPVGLAHTDVAEQFPNTSLDQVVRTIANARLFYEVSTKFGSVSRTQPWFRTLPNHRVRISIGTDTHDDLSCLQEIGRLADIIEQCRLHDKLLVPKIRSDEAVGSR